MATEMLAALRHRGRRPLLALCLTLCLLLAQYAGLVHRVLHGGIGGLAQASVSTSGDIQDPHAGDALRKAGHSCVLFDGAASGDAACGTPSLPTLSHGMPFVPPGISWRWPHLPPQRGFLTRAPPSRSALG